MQNKSEKLLFIIILFSALPTFFHNILKWWPLTIDDAYITFRYAENLASGYGITYNPGQPPIEGYTTFLWAIIMSIPHFLNIDAILFSKFVGLACTIFSALIGFKFTLLLTGTINKSSRYLAAATFVLIFSVLKATAIHSVAGMETSLYTFLIISFFFLIYKFLTFPTKTVLASSVLTALLIGLTRPEGNLISVLTLSVAFILTPKKQKAHLAIASTLLYLIPGLIYFLWRFNYYGLLFPLSFYIKVSNASPLAGIYPVANFLTSIVCLPLWPLVSLALFRLPKKSLVFIIPCTAILVFYLFPSHMMGYEYRFLYPILPLILMISAVGLAILLQLLSRPENVFANNRILSKLICCCLCLIIPFGLFINGNQNKKRENYSKGLANAHIALGKKLFQLKQQIKYTPTLAIDDAGAVPYYSKWLTIDTYGLNNPHLAVLDKHVPEYVDYIINKNPNLVIIISYSNDVLTVRQNIFRQSLYNRCLQKGMTRIKSLEFSTGYYLWLIADPKSDIAKNLKEWH